MRWIRSRQRPQQTWQHCLSRHDSNQEQNYSRGTASRESWDHSNLEPENRYDSRDRKDERPRINAVESGRVESERKGAHRIDFVEDGMDCKPDRKVQHNANYGCGDRGEGTV